MLLNEAMTSLLADNNIVVVADSPDALHGNPSLINSWSLGVWNDTAVPIVVRLGIVCAEVTGSNISAFDVFGADAGRDLDLVPIVGE